MPDARHGCAASRGEGPKPEIGSRWQGLTPIKRPWIGSRWQGHRLATMHSAQLSRWPGLGAGGKLICETRVCTRRPELCDVPVCRSLRDLNCSTAFRCGDQNPTGCTQAFVYLCILILMHTYADVRTRKRLYISCHVMYMLWMVRMMTMLMMRTTYSSAHITLVQSRNFMTSPSYSYI